MATEHDTATNDTAKTNAHETAAQKPRESEAEMRAKMIAQQRAMRCVGCGEGEEYF